MGKNYKYEPPPQLFKLKEDCKKWEIEHDTPTWEEALAEIIQEMEIMGRSDRTVRDYLYHFNRMVRESSSVIYTCRDIHRKDLMNYLSVGDVSNNTRLVRLKNVRPVLKMMYQRRYILEEFWEGIDIPKTTDIRKETTTEDIHTLLGQLDTDDFVEFRDYVFVRLVYETGLRAGTMSYLELDMFDFDRGLLNIPGSIMKGRVGSSKPIPDYFEGMVRRLNSWNQIVLAKHKTHVPYLFITSQGNTFENKKNHQSNIVKRLNKYNERFNIHVTAHGIRSNFATQLAKNGVSLTTIQSALDHKSLETTQRYLDLDVETKNNEIRQFLYRRY